MKKIILPENIKAMLEKEECCLNRANVRIFTSTDNEDALSHHRTEKADLIVANLDTKKMNGETLTSLIRDDNTLRNVSIIIISSGTELDAQRCLQCRANAFIISPINNAILLQEMYQLLYIAPRKSLRVPLSIKIHVTSKGRPSIGYGENISVSGMLLHSETMLAEGDTITCSFYLPDATHIATTAEVVRMLEKATEHDTNGYGIKFIELSDNCHSAIERFIGREGRGK